MARYSRQLVKDYLMGFEISNVEELENSKNFMMQAIDESGDYRLYNLCSDKLKVNCSFVKYLIKKFSNNHDFIYKVADYFLENTKNDLYRFDISIMMIDLSNDDLKKNFYYRMYSHSLYCYIRIQVEKVKQKLKNKELVDEIGMGFELMHEVFSDNDIVNNYIARKMIDGIFDENGISLELLLHKKYHDPSDIDKDGVNNFMIEFVKQYDIKLAYYLCFHPELLDDFRKKINNIKTDWRIFEKRTEMNKILLIFDRVHKYLQDKETILDETTLIYYAGRKLGLEEKLLEHDTLYDSKEELFEDIDFVFAKEVLENNFEERIHLKKIETIIKNILLFNDENDKENESEGTLVYLNRNSR